MKKIILLSVLLIIAFALLAQIPQAFNYQTVVRGATGEILSGQNISLQISIHEWSAIGTIIYQENHDVTTNQFGLANLEIGLGLPIIGDFISIDWGMGLKFMEVALDPTGGNTYVSMGTSQLLSVPYALHSGTTSDTSTWKKEADDIYYKNGKVGIGTDTPAQLLSTNGIIESMTDGFMFPDGTVQTTAAESSSGGTSDSIVFGGPPTAAEQRGFIGMVVEGVEGSWEWELECDSCSVVFDMEWSMFWTGGSVNYIGDKGHNSLTIYKNIDKASVPLLQKTVMAEWIPKVQFRFYRYNPAISNYEIYYTITLVGAIIADFSHDVYHTGNGNMAHMDKISFIYETIIWEWLDGNIIAQDDL